MQIEVKVPEVGESVREAVLAQWYRHDGDMVHKGEILFLIETDKVTLEVSAEADGILKILVPEGKTVPIGAVVGTIDTEAERGEAPPPRQPELKPPEEAHETSAARESARTVAPAPSVRESPMPGPGLVETGTAPIVSPSVRELLEEKGLEAAMLTPTGPGGRLTRGDVFRYLDDSEAEAEVRVAKAEPPVRPDSSGTRGRVQLPQKVVFRPEETTVRKPMSPIRQRIAERLLEARQNTAMLTTFNEIDMSRLQELRVRFRELFRNKYSVSLGMMSFFLKAATVGLKELPELNAFIEGKEIVYHNYYHIGVAVGGERGLVVPVIRNVDRLSFAELETAIVDFVRKIRENRLEISDLEGGTFTISNGGVYGSLMSTPILNSPQSAILGMHKVEDRPVVVDGQIVIRPMMYVALSYDHRIVDGREAVTFLKRVKECIENPERIMVEI